MECKNTESNPQDTKTNIRIKLENNLDQLLYDKNYSTDKGGLFLPTSDDPGTGNIVIKGSPGTGKSTLALQILYQTTQHRETNSKGEVQPSAFYALYFSLEEQIDHIINKIDKYNWNNYSQEKGEKYHYKSLKKLIHLQNTDDSTSPEKLAGYLKNIFSQPDDCKIRNLEKTDMICNHFSCSSNGVKQTSVHYNSQVFFPMLSPREFQEENNESIYWQRYKEIEKYLIADDYIRSNKENFVDVPELKIVCIDSINVFGNSQLSRDEIFRLFDLFKCYGVIGIIIFENNQEHANASTSQLCDDLEFSADVVISLQNEQDGYMMRYLEIEKSRYKPQVFGKHPYYIVNMPEPKDKEEQSKPCEPFLPFWVYPSLHYKLNEYSHKEMTSNKETTSNEVKKDLLTDALRDWKKKFGNIFPDSRNSSEEREPLIISLTGPRNTFKSVIAKEFLIQGHQYISKKNNNTQINGMIICLGGKHYYNPSDWLNYSENQDDNIDDVNPPEYKEDLGYLPGISIRQKLDIKRWYIDQGKKIEDSPFILSVVINKKAISAEEFIHHLQYNILNKCPSIKRVVLDEINMIGVSYPFLHSSKTSNGLFLNALVELLRGKGIDLIMTGTSGEMVQSDEVISRAISLSDIILNTRFCDVFGKQNAIITGGGLVDNEINNIDDNKFTPGVLLIGKSETSSQADSNKSTPEGLLVENNEASSQADAKQSRRPWFTINHDHLNGLVGFENGKVYRPGLTLNLFEEGLLQTKYNQQIKIMYNLFFPKHTNGTSLSDNEKKVSITTFNDRDVEGIQETIKCIQNHYPFDGTVVSMVDEYWHDEVKKMNKNSQRRLYYTNCLVLAYRTDILECDLKQELKKPITWESIYGYANGKRKEPEQSTDKKLCFLDADFFIPETLSCLLLDTMVNVYPKRIIQKGEQSEEQLKKEQLNNVLKDFCANDYYDKKLVQQLYYLNQLFKSLKSDDIKIKHSTANVLDKQNNMYSNSLMYVCWFTQLREFLSYHPDYVPNIGIAALPGGGFSGDWMLEVMPGSLNKELGTNTLNLLCNPNEEIKRFIQGVGLPAWLNKEYYKEYNIKDETDKQNSSQIETLAESFPAWIGAKDLTLKEISTIYGKVHRRKDISQYSDLRHVLSINFRWLMSINIPDEIKDDFARMEIYEKEALPILKKLKEYITDKTNK